VVCDPAFPDWDWWPSRITQRARSCPSCGDAREIPFDFAQGRLSLHLKNGSARDDADVIAIPATSFQKYSEGFGLRVGASRVLSGYGHAFADLRR